MKIVRNEFCATLQNRSEAMRKDHKWMKREMLGSTRYRCDYDISAPREVLRVY